VHFVDVVYVYPDGLERVLELERAPRVAVEWGIENADSYIYIWEKRTLYLVQL
jgi:hypothetical protein